MCCYCLYYNDLCYFTRPLRVLDRAPKCKRRLYRHLRSYRRRYCFTIFVILGRLSDKNLGSSSLVAETFRWFQPNEISDVGDVIDGAVTTAISWPPSFTMPVLERATARRSGFAPGCRSRNVAGESPAPFSTLMTITWLASSAYNADQDQEA